jgi:hypothetical protein
LVSVPNFEFAVGFGSFPINGLVHSIYNFQPIPIDLQTSDTYTLNPSGTFSLSSIYLYARWYPWTSGWFLQTGFYSMSFSANISGALVDQTQGTSSDGAISGSVSITQTMIELGPGYQIVFGSHLHLDLGVGVLYLLPGTSSTDLGGSLSNFVTLNSTANANYEAAKASLATDVNQAMSSYRDRYKFLPSAFLSLGYIF